MDFFCPNCWEKVPEKAKHCPACGRSLAADGEDYVDKLLTALHHFEPMRAALAIQILSEMMGEPRAIVPLVELLDTAHDANVLRSAVVALGRFAKSDSERLYFAVPALSRRALDWASPLVVRLAAVDTLAQIGGGQALAAIEGALDDSNFSVRELARQRLEREFGAQKALDE